MSIYDLALQAANNTATANQTPLPRGRGEGDNRAEALRQRAIAASQGTVPSVTLPTGRGEGDNRAALMRSQQAGQGRQDAIAAVQGVPSSQSAWDSYVTGRGGTMPTFEEWQEGVFQGTPLSLSGASRYNSFLNDIYAQDSAGQNETFKEYGLRHDSPWGEYGWTADPGIEALGENQWRPQWQSGLTWEDVLRGSPPPGLPDSGNSGDGTFGGGMNNGLGTSGHLGGPGPNNGMGRF